MWASATIDGRNAEAPPVPGLSPADRHHTLDQLVDLRIEESESLEDLARTLYWLLSGGYSVWTDGSLYYARALVERLGQLEIVIQLNEHAPPHFHVRAGDIDASFRIEDCSLLAGEIDGRSRDLVERWYRTGRPKLIRKWNDTRSSNCPVGPIRT
jgi:Domain of unknown function (DUF4160)